MANSSIFKALRARLPSSGQRLLTLCTQYDDDILIILCLGFSNATIQSVQVGSWILMSSILLLFWIRGYQMPRDHLSLVGPYRFVRYPRRLALWLIALAASFAALSFPAMVWSLGMLPWFLDRDEAHHLLEQPLTAHRHYERYVPKLLPTLMAYQGVKNRESQPRFRWLKAILSPGFLRKRSIVAIIFLALCLSIPLLIPLPDWIHYALLGVWIAARVVIHITDNQNRDVISKI